jgi:hypothetical protein
LPAAREDDAADEVAVCGADVDGAELVPPDEVAHLAERQGAREGVVNSGEPLAGGGDLDLGPAGPRHEGDPFADGGPCERAAKGRVGAFHQVGVADGAATPGPGPVFASFWNSLPSRSGTLCTFLNSAVMYSASPFRPRPSISSVE